MKTRLRHSGKDVCIYCHNKTYNSGHDNGFHKHFKNDCFFEKIDSELKSYILGLIAGDGSLENNGKRVVLYANQSDIESLEVFRKAIAPTSVIVNDEGCFNVRINSVKIVSDICQHLKIIPGSKHDKLSLPEINEKFQWDFIRGLFDSDGSVFDPSKKCTSPRCKITSNSKQLLKDISSICLDYNINTSLGKKDLYFTGIHAQAFLRKIYKNSNYKLSRKYERFLIWDTWIPHYGTSIRKRKNARKEKKVRS